MNNDPKDLQNQKKQKADNDQFGTSSNPDSQHESKNSSHGQTDGSDLGKDLGGKDNATRQDQQKK